MLSERERFICLVDGEVEGMADAIILLTGDGYSRLCKTVELYRGVLARWIVITGGVDKPEQGSFKAGATARVLENLGVRKNDIVIDEASMNTREQAVKVMGLVKRNGWKKILLVASHYHQYRAYLTFLQARKEAGLDVHIINVPARYLPWHSSNPWGRRIDLLEDEFDKIEKYRELGHIASYADAFQHSREKEEAA